MEYKYVKNRVPVQRWYLVYTVQSSKSYTRVYTRLSKTSESIEMVSLTLSLRVVYLEDQVRLELIDVRLSVTVLQKDLLVPLRTFLFLRQAESRVTSYGKRVLVNNCKILDTRSGGIILKSFFFTLKSSFLTFVP